MKIEFKNGRPAIAHVTQMADDEFEVACEVAANLEKDKRKTDALLARKNKFGNEKSSLRKVAKGKVTKEKAIPQPRKSRNRSS